MNRPKYTPGPWIPEWADLRAEVLGKQARLFLGLYAAPPGDAEATYVIVPHQWASNCMAMAATDADIRLIAQAPAMAELLLEIAEDKPCNGVESLGHAETCDRCSARAILRKIEGD